MSLFKNILVGIDLTRCTPLDVSGLTPVAREPIHWGIGLARINSARLLFFSAVDSDDESLLSLASADLDQAQDTFFEDGARVLQELVEQARQQGVDAHCKLVPGKSSREIIRQVLRDKHDLVVVGTRNVTTLERILFGSTARKLLRSCPCPVLVAKPATFASGFLGAALHRTPGIKPTPLHIVIATDLKPSSEPALKLGIALANELHAQAHVLHVVEYQLDEVCNIGLPDAKQAAYRQKVRVDAQGLLQAQLAKTDYQALGSHLELDLAGDVGQPDVAIQQFIQTHNIHLLVLGTIARGGIQGMMIGNKAERLLPEVSCSVLAVKPADFVCPIEV
jgi:universal stress protein E